jgi:uncharacterized membrane protein YdfJ with MMPL/SSD domain
MSILSKALISELKLQRNTAELSAVRISLLTLIAVRRNGVINFIMIYLGNVGIGVTVDCIYMMS